MSGSVTGGLKCSATNKRLYGSDYYHKLGKIGGLAKVPKGFAMNPKLASKAGALGGAKSKRRKNV